MKVWQIHLVKLHPITVKTLQSTRLAETQNFNFSKLYQPCIIPVSREWNNNEVKLPQIGSVSRTSDIQQQVSEERYLQIQSHQSLKWKGD